MIVDWSAENRPKTGKDSIWIALAETKHGLLSMRNVPTRHEAMLVIEAECRMALATGKKLFIGFDFAFGYPAGAAKAFSKDGRWSDIWCYIFSHIEDNPRNENNRFVVGAKINEVIFPDFEGPFWNHPNGQSYKYLSKSKPENLSSHISEHRLTELPLTGTHSVWKLYTPGSVGGQSLVGIARLQRLRTSTEFSDHIAVWPFETEFAKNFPKQITLAEIYPSAFSPIARADEVKDAAQVRTLAEGFAALDAKNRFTHLLARPDDLSEEDYLTVIREEGWIVGAGWQGALS